MTTTSLFTPAPGPPYPKPPPDIQPDWCDRFFASVYKFSKHPLACHIWTGPFDGCGYGMFSHNRVSKNGKRTAAIRAHMFIMQQWLGFPIFGGLVVMHACDCPQCVNPLHLFLGTIQDNMNDRNQKGRQAHGERHSKALLTESKILQIRSSNEHPNIIAARFGVSASNIYSIIARRSWRHI